MEEENIQLGEKLVGEIEGEFYVPSYQRGYRWDETQVRQLLNDITENGDNAYCLQPLVVRKKADGSFELIDGQQRLTTIYILMKYIKDIYKPRLKINYTLSYETRKGSTDFLNNIDEKKADENIDYWFMYNTYKTIDEWFKKQEEIGNDQQAADLFALYFFPKVGNGIGGNVKFIWYEVQNVNDKDAIALFTRLNIGRIPLTNAELIKALFLCNTKQMENKRQLEIALQWDTIERELHDDDFWYFLTKKKAETYATRIELLFDFFASDRDNQNDPLSTFLYFNEIKKAGKDLSILWEDLLRYYYRLKEWYKKNALYHRIGYLVASGHMTMNQIVDATINLRKSEQEQLLDEEIKKSIQFKKAYSDLNYVNNYDEISRLLLLFNVVSVMNRTHSRFPFRAYNTELWSLEHIHPQHPEDMKNDKKLWNEWLRIQKLSVEQMPVDNETDRDRKDALVADTDAFINNERATKEDFKTLSNRIVQFLSDRSEDDLTHSLSNMALLSKSQNSALNNSLFDAKRREIIDMDRRGEFIPYCTRNVFLKYYTSPDKIQMVKWSEADREGYVAAMNKVLEPYKNEVITL
mgnify:FL=1